MLPPFYYKDVVGRWLFASYAEVIERVGDARLRVYLYHIPQVSRVPIGLALIERLLQRYPGTVAGIKDSSGDWNNTQAMLERFQPRGFDVFSGSETFLLATLRAGGAGCISATANVNPAAIAQLHGMAGAGRRRAAGGARRRARGIPEVPDDSRAQGRRRALLRRRLRGRPCGRRSLPSPRISGGSCWKR